MLCFNVFPYFIFIIFTFFHSSLGKSNYDAKCRTTEAWSKRANKTTTNKKTTRNIYLLNNPSSIEKQLIKKHLKINVNFSINKLNIYFFVPSSFRVC